MADEPIRVFVYGTLIEGFGNNRRVLRGRGLILGRGWTFGEVYHLPEGYPALIPGNSKVRGQLLEFDGESAESVMGDLDLLEGCIPGDCENSLYIRRKVPVEMEDGSQLTAWTYFYNDTAYPANHGRHITDGNWQKFATRENIKGENHPPV